MPENKKKSGFYYFMKDFKKTEEQRGKIIDNLNQIRADSRCDQAWKALSSAERAKYHNMAKRKGGEKNSEEKLTGIGEPLKLVEKRTQERSDYLLRMRTYIDNVIEHALRLDDLRSTPFYFIHVNWYYTKTNVEDNSVEYIPAEFAVVEFTLDKGIKRIYHDIIKVNIEIGYSREAMQHSDATHKIDVNRKVEETKFNELFNKFNSFLTSQSESGQDLPVLYTINKLETVVRCFLKKMCKDAGVSHDTFKLYSLDYLFGTLMMYLDDNFPRTSNRAALAEAEFDKNSFIFITNIECSYHRNIEGTSAYCSQSVITQWVFTICDYCCLILGIEMISGMHRPYRIDEQVASGIHALNIKKIEKISSIKSETGVSEAHRLKVSERSRKEEELRKKQGKDILFIDHSQLPKPDQSVIIPSASLSTCSSSSFGSMESVSTSSIRPPSTISEVLKRPVNSPMLNNNKEFPALNRFPETRPFKKY